MALGVGLTPEFLPMIASVTLARGALRMVRDHVIVKAFSHLSRRISSTDELHGEPSNGVAMLVLS